MNDEKYFFIPDWLLSENSQTIHAYIFILNEINNNGGDYKTSYRKLAKKLNLSLRNIRTILSILTQQTTHKVTQLPTHSETLLSIDFVGVLKENKKRNDTARGTQTTQQEAHKKQSIQDRKQAFVEDLKNYTELYHKDLLNDFYRYWGETDKQEQKMRFEFQKTWNLKLRLITWSKNANKMFQANKNNKEPTIGRTSIETIKKNAEYNGEY